MPSRADSPLMAANGVTSSLWDMSPDMLAVASRNGHLTAVNPSWEKTLGYSPAELTSRPYLDFVHPDDIAKTVEEAEALFGSDHVTVSFENRWQANDGNYRWLAWSASPSDDPEAIWCIVRDVTDHRVEEFARADQLDRLRQPDVKANAVVCEVFTGTAGRVQAAQKRQANEHHYRLVAENATDVVLRVGVDGIVEWASPAVAVLLGWQPEQFVGRRYANFLHPDNRAHAAGNHAAVMRGESASGHVQVKCADGSYRWVAATSRPFRDDAGMVIGRIVGWTDAEAEMEARAALREFEEQYRLLSENSTGVVWRLDCDSVMRWVSPSLESVLGWRPGELLGTKPLQLTHPADQQDVTMKLAEMFEGTQIPQFELRMRTAYGSYRWMSIQVRPTASADGSVKGVIVGLRDVHREVVARQRIARSESMFRLALDGAPQGMAVVGLDLEFMEVNTALCAMLHRDEEWLLAHTVRDVVHPVDLEADVSGRHQIIRGAVDTQVHERRWLKADGSELWVLHSTGLLRDEQGRPLFYVLHVQDITDAHRAREFEEQYRLLAENSTGVVWRLDSDSVMRWVSPSLESVLGWRPEQLIGTQPLELTHPADQRDVTIKLAELFYGTQIPQFELRMRTADSSYLWMSIQVRPTTSADGSVNGVIVGLRDVHEEVLARQRVARSERLFHLAMDGAPQGMAVVGLHLRFLEVNTALCGMLGRDEQWLLAHTVRDVVHPDEIELDLLGRDELLSGAAETQVHERRWLKSDGSELWVLHSTGLLRDEQGMPLFYVSHVQDNTDAHD